MLLISYHQTEHRCYDLFCSDPHRNSVFLTRRKFFIPTSANRYTPFYSHGASQQQLYCRSSMFLLWFWEYDSQTNRDTHLTKEMHEASDFISIDPETHELRHTLELLQPYESDKIKFMTKVEVFDHRCEGIRTKIKIIKEPIFATEDVIVFLLVLQWYPNSLKTSTKTRKGSFATQKQLKVRFQKAVVDQQQLLRIAYVLSEKLYIHQNHIDAYVKAVSCKQDASHRHQNHLTVILDGGNLKRQLPHLASTMDDTRQQNYWFDSSSYTVEDRFDNTNAAGSKQEDFFNKILPLAQRSSRFFQKSSRSPRISMGSRESLSEETYRKGIGFNLAQAKKWFSSVQYIQRRGQIDTETIVYHLNDSQNISGSGIRLQSLQVWLEEWPRHSSYNKLYTINRGKVLSSLLEEAKSNYRVMMSMEFQEVNEKGIGQIYQAINEFSQKTVQQFSIAAKQYLYQPEYNEYLSRLEAELTAMETELLNNYGICKKQYGSRILKNLERKNCSMGNYTLMKILGKQKINDLQIGFRRYKEIICDNYLEQCFEDFKHRKNRDRGRFYNKGSANHEQEELNYVENRIEICEGKKVMLDKAIELETREKESLQLMLQLIEKEEVKESSGSERLTF